MANGAVLWLLVGSTTSRCNGSEWCRHATVALKLDARQMFEPTLLSLVRVTTDVGQNERTAELPNIIVAVTKATLHIMAEPQASDTHSPPCKLSVKLRNPDAGSAFSVFDVYIFVHARTRD